MTFFQGKIVIFTVVSSKVLHGRVNNVMAGGCSLLGLHAILLHLSIITRINFRSTVSFLEISFAG